MINAINRMKGQSTLEYAILIIIIIGALLSIQMYLKRSIQGKLKSSADDIGDQFSPGNTNAIKTTVSSSATVDRVGLDENGGAAQGLTRSQLTADDRSDTQERAQIINTQQEFWGQAAQ